MITNLETTILRGLIHNEDYTRKVLPYVKDVYFETTTSRTYFELCSEHFSTYNSCPTKESLAIQIEQLNGINEEDYRNIGQAFEGLTEKSDPQNLEFLVDETEKWCQERAVYLALLESISIHDGKGDQDRGSIPALLSDALAVSFDPHVGHDYLNDFSERYDFYHQKTERISFGLEYFDKITKGGIPNKTLNIALAGTGVGKSLFMCSMASTVLLQ